MSRSFVKHRNDVPSARPPRLTRTLGKDGDTGRAPRVSIVIPTADGSRDGYLPALLTQLESQTFQDFEVLVLEGDNRQGRAINSAVDVARGEFLVTFDDDTRLGATNVLELLVQALQADPGIGMAGGANLIPEDAPLLLRRVMQEMPRRQTPPVSTVTDSDLAEHPCLAMRREIFCAVGGENELIPRGLDPYLREAVREAGWRVVVVPGVYYHHLPPKDLVTLVRQFFRNGAQSRFCALRYPQWVYETAESHGAFVSRRPLAFRVARGIADLMMNIVSLRFFYVLCRLSYAAGWAWEGLRQQWRTTH